MWWLVRALTDSATYNMLELRTGRLAKINPGDVLIGVLGRRRALKGFVGDVPETVNAGDQLAPAEHGWRDRELYRASFQSRATRSSWRLWVWSGDENRWRAQHRRPRARAAATTLARRCRWFSSPALA